MAMSFRSTLIPLYRRSRPTQLSKRFFSQRRPELAEVIREGLGHLNDSASYIQNNARTRKPITMKESEESNERQKSEGHRLLSAAIDSLEAISLKDPTFTIQGEPIVLLDIHVKPSIKAATIYWTLPYRVLLNDSLTDAQKILIQAQMEANIEKNRGQALLQRRISSMLRHYFPPKIRLEPASQEMIVQLLKDLDELDE